MRFLLVGILAVGILGARAPFAQEVAVPDKPITSTVTSYEIEAFSWERLPEWRFTIRYRDNNGVTYADEHYGLVTMPGPTGPIKRAEGADEFMLTLNTLNLSTTSMIKRLLQHLVQHGKIPASSVQGTPPAVPK